MTRHVRDPYLIPNLNLDDFLPTSMPGWPICAAYGCKAKVDRKGANCNNCQVKCPNKGCKRYKRVNRYFCDECTCDMYQHGTMKVLLVNGPNFERQCTRARFLLNEDCIPTKYCPVCKISIILFLFLKEEEFPRDIIKKIFQLAKIPFPLKKLK